LTLYKITKKLFSHIMLCIDMKINKVLKRDIEKHLGIIPDKRRNDFKKFIAENGGFDNAIETLKSRLSGLQEYKVKKQVREKQVVVQKKYVEKKETFKDYRYIGTNEVEFKITKEYDEDKKKNTKSRRH
jgi:hypothetical protein